MSHQQPFIQQAPVSNDNADFQSFIQQAPPMADNKDDNSDFSPVQQRPPPDSGHESKIDGTIHDGIPPNPYLRQMSEMHSNIGKYLKADKMGLFDFTIDSPQGILGVLKAAKVGERVAIEYTHPGNWFNKLALKLTTTKTVPYVTEGLYRIWVYHGSYPVRHTGVKFQSFTTGETFLFDVQSFDLNLDLSFTPVFREEPEPSERPEYVPIGYQPQGQAREPGAVYLSRGLLQLLSSIPSHSYTLKGDNCRDGLLCTILLCQFWNASLGIPQCIDVDSVADFITDIYNGDSELLRLIGWSVTKTNQQRRDAMHQVLQELAKCSRYDQTIEDLQSQQVIGAESMFEVK